MRRYVEFALAAILPAALAVAQQASTPVPSPPAASAPAAQTVYYAGPGVTAPELLPVTVTDLVTGHCKKLDGTTTVSAVVDTNGVPRNVILLLPARNELDQEALRLVSADRFKPGTHDGAPAATLDSIEVHLKACIENEKNETGQNVQLLRLHSVPDQKLRLMEASPESAPQSSGSTTAAPAGDLNVLPYKVGGGISAPVPTHQEIAQFSDEARRTKYQGTCVIAMTVDEHGMPQNAHVIRSLGRGLDEKALEAVRKYRFKPARKKDGTPVPVMITVEVDFHLYN